MKPTAELRPMLLYGLVLLTVTGLILWLNRPTQSVLPPARQLTNTQLDPDRQVVRMKLDSLTAMLHQIQHDNPDGFTWTDEGSRLSVQAKELNAFNQIFFDGGDLSAFAVLTDSPLRVRSGNNGFDLSIARQGGIRLVTLPADLIHNLQLHQKNQRL
jgi:hypothetical protein